jgi:lambda family phage minor tail protein L
MVAGSTTNVTSVELRAVDTNGSSQHSGGSFLSTIGDDLRRSKTLTNTAGTTGTQPRLTVGNSDTIDITLEISGIQHELASAASDIQLTRASGFDVTEDGQRSVYYLQPDGIDDWMTLTTAFQPISTYTMAVAQDHTTVTTATVSVFFGRGSGGGGLQYARRGTNSLALRANSSTNVTTHTSTQLGSAAAGRAVFVSRVADAGLAQTYANGVGPLAGTLTGVMLPAAPTGIGALFRTSAEYGRNRFYSGVLVPAAITEQERLSLEQYLTERLQAPPEFDWFVRVKNSSVYRTGDNVISTAGNVESTVLAIDANNTIYLSNQLDLATQINRPLYIINQEADAESYIEDIFKIEQLESLTEDVATFGLVSWLQYFKSVLPKRRYYKNTCQWKYKGPECQYPENGTGTIPGTVPAVSANGFFTNNNVVTTDPNDDVCSKSFAACSLRRNTLHFGGFPGTGRSVPKV